MPLYEWLDKNKDQLIEVIRDAQFYERPPTREEAGDDWTDEEFETASWQRLIRNKNPHRRAYGFGSKGNW